MPDRRTWNKSAEAGWLDHAAIRHKETHRFLQESLLRSLETTLLLACARASSKQRFGRNIASVCNSAESARMANARSGHSTWLAAAKQQIIFRYGSENTRFVSTDLGLHTEGFGFTVHQSRLSAAEPSQLGINSVHQHPIKRRPADINGSPFNNCQQ